mmetsp:Transcript_146651/g.381165  ORF Transcript_146651/g.381165 Transcript_146651/m.381165 type:complete len:247 (-) Transcript_146651:1875-2615(-)
MDEQAAACQKIPQDLLRATILIETIMTSGQFMKETLSEQAPANQARAPARGLQPHSSKIAAQASARACVEQPRIPTATSTALLRAHLHGDMQVHVCRGAACVCAAERAPIEAEEARAPQLLHGVRDTPVGGARPLLRDEDPDLRQLRGGPVHLEPHLHAGGRCKLLMDGCISHEACDGIARAAEALAQVRAARARVYGKGVVLQAWGDQCLAAQFGGRGAHPLRIGRVIVVEQRQHRIRAVVPNMW